MPGARLNCGEYQRSVSSTPFTPAWRLSLRLENKLSFGCVHRVFKTVLESASLCVALSTGLGPVQACTSGPTGADFVSSTAHPVGNFLPRKHLSLNLNLISWGAETSTVTARVNCSLRVFSQSPNGRRHVREDRRELKAVAGSMTEYFRLGSR